MKITAEPRGDQWNADDFIGGPRTFTIAGVKMGTAEQKYDIELVEGEGRSWRPPLTMLRLLIAAWGDDASVWTGRRVTLYRDESVRFGSDAVGGIRIKYLSDLPGNRPLTAMLTSTRGRRARYTVDPLPAEWEPAATQKPKGGPTAAGVIKAFEAMGVTTAQLELRIGADHEKWTTEDIAQLAAIGKAIKDGDSTAFEEFDPVPAEQPAEGVQETLG